MEDELMMEAELMVSDRDEVILIAIREPVWLMHEDEPGCTIVANS